MCMIGVFAVSGALADLSVSQKEINVDFIDSRPGTAAAEPAEVAAPAPAQYGDAKAARLDLQWDPNGGTKGRYVLLVNGKALDWEQDIGAAVDFCAANGIAMERFEDGNGYASIQEIVLAGNIPVISDYGFYEVGIMLSNGELTLTAGTTTMIFTREAQAGKAPAIEVRADAAAEEFNGKWTCVALSMDGQTVDAATAKAIGQVLPDMDFDNGVIKMSGGPIAEIFSSLSKSLTYADGAYSLAADSGNVSITVNMLQDGTMSLTFAVGEQSTTLSFAKAE